MGRDQLDDSERSGSAARYQQRPAARGGVLRVLHDLRSRREQRIGGYAIFSERWAGAGGRDTDARSAAYAIVQNVLDGGFLPLDGHLLRRRALPGRGTGGARNRSLTGEVEKQLGKLGWARGTLIDRVA